MSQVGITLVIDCSGTFPSVSHLNGIRVFSFAAFLKNFPKESQRFSLNENFILAVETCLSFARSCVDKGGRILFASNQSNFAEESRSLALISFFLVRYYGLSLLEAIFFLRRKCPTLCLKAEIIKILAFYSSSIVKIKSKAHVKVLPTARVHRCLCGACNVSVKADKNIATFTNVSNLEFSLMQIYHLYGIEMNSIQWEVSSFEHLDKYNFEDAVEVQNYELLSVKEGFSRCSVSKSGDYKLFQCKHCYFPVFASLIAKEDTFTSHSNTPILIVNDSPLSEDWLAFNDIRPVLFQVISQKI